jgi:anti-anti-sigma regulatory factor
MQHSFVIDKNCTLREAEAFKSALQAAEDSSGDLVIQAGAVERIDTAGLQLLAGFAARLRLLDRRLVWAGASDVLTTAAAQLGLAEALGFSLTPTAGAGA